MVWSVGAPEYSLAPSSSWIKHPSRKRGSSAGGRPSTLAEAPSYAVGASTLLCVSNAVQEERRGKAQTLMRRASQRNARLYRPVSVRPLLSDRAPCDATQTQRSNAVRREAVRSGATPVSVVSEEACHTRPPLWTLSSNTTPQPKPAH
eukprot:3118039-Rhodomonas_salina.3